MSTQKQIVSDLETNKKLIGKVVDFQFGNADNPIRLYGKINDYLQTFDTYLIKEPKGYGKHTFLSDCQVELESHEIIQVLENKQPEHFHYYWVSQQFSIYSSFVMDLTDNHVKIRFSELANNEQLLKFTPFVGTQIENDNTNWFAGYLLAFEKYDSYYSKEGFRKDLNENPLLTLHIAEDYEFRKEFMEVYNKIDNLLKQ